ncbi:MAG: excinuclease ABC subunit B [Parcubacteria group bacterium RIFCSPHIGHO2_01_FULL_47_10b]|nr:MAG: excinuclease ABC subunit B [Parcubacteria group bacterium RIFCSPHIGHO2_01_FULL_47_10b]
MKFTLKSKLQPQGDQAQAISKLTTWIAAGNRHQSLLGITGSGKTFTAAKVIEALQRPTLIISHNKTLASQLYQEFRDFFPDNAVHYFVSYYDYYQPEAYIPHSDTYIEKDAQINEEIDRLRHGATQDILTRDDVIIVASVSCIYNIGSREEYMKVSIRLALGQKLTRKSLLDQLARLQYSRNDYELLPGTFRVRGEAVDIFSPTGNEIIRVESFGDTIEAVKRARYKNPRELFEAEKRLEQVPEAIIFPAKHFVTPLEKLDIALANIRAEMTERVAWFRKHNKLLEAQRLEERTTYDLELLRSVGFVSGIENYSRQLEFRAPETAPNTLLNFFPKNYLTIVDESHMTLPQVRGMYKGDRSRKQTLIDYGFRLPSALDNRPLTIEEFDERTNQFLYMSATPAEHELRMSSNKTAPAKQRLSQERAAGMLRFYIPGVDFVAEQVVRPTGLLDPTIDVRPSHNQLPDLIKEAQTTIKRNARVLVTTVTKRLSELLAEHFREAGIKAEYLHADVETFDRIDLLYRLRKGDIECLVGINLLREGLDLPEVELVAILDADKEGFLRNARTLIQTIGRAARNSNGRVIMYADRTTDSMKTAIEETRRRRTIQEAYNAKHHITPKTIYKELKEFALVGKKKQTKKEVLAQEISQRIKQATEQERHALIKDLRTQMLEASDQLEFERAAVLRDQINEFVKRSK